MHRAQAEEIDLLGARWRLADERQSIVVDERIDGAGFSRVGAPGEGDLRA